MDKQGRASSDAGATGSVAKLLQAVALAAVLVPFGSVAVETAPITCGFGGFHEYNGPDGEFRQCENLPTETGQSSRFDFGPYWVDITLFDAMEFFSITVEDDPMNQEEFELRTGHFVDFSIASHLDGYTCIPMVDPAANAEPCRNFDVTAPPRENPQGDLWSSYLIKLAWLFDSENNGYPGGDGRARILHGFGSFFYDEDMCETAMTNPDYVPCEYFGGNPGDDPWISSGNTDFSPYTAALAPQQVPEPATLLLVGAGASGVLWRYRRSRR